MSKKMLSNSQVFDIVESEGLGYAIQFYMNEEKIADKELAKYWKQAKDAIDNIQSILDEAGPTEEDWTEEDNDS